MIDPMQRHVNPFLKYRPTQEQLNINMPNMQVPEHLMQPGGDRELMPPQPLQMEPAPQAPQEPQMRSVLRPEDRIRQMMKQPRW